MSSCPVCEKPLPANRTRPFVYCSHNCSQRAYYARHRVRLLARRRDKQARLMGNEDDDD
jgi:predicted nucleic acid-binding Zn ribbon protein